MTVTRAIGLESEYKVVKVRNMLPGTVFRFPGESAYLIRIDPVGPMGYNAVCLNAHDHRYKALERMVQMVLHEVVFRGPTGSLTKVWRQPNGLLGIAYHQNVVGDVLGWVGGGAVGSPGFHDDDLAKSLGASDWHPSSLSVARLKTMFKALEA